MLTIVVLMAAMSSVMIAITRHPSLRGTRSGVLLRPLNTPRKDFKHNNKNDAKNWRWKRVVLA
jgi:hypothetical protein